MPHDLVVFGLMGLEKKNCKKGSQIEPRYNKVCGCIRFTFYVFQTSIGYIINLVLH